MRSKYSPTLVSRRELLSASLLAGLGRGLAGAPLSQIRLGVTTDEIDEDLGTAIQFLKSYGLSYAEIRNLWGKYNTSLPLDKIREARALLDANQMRLSVLGTPFFKVPLPADTPEGRTALEREWTLLDGAMERASILGTNTLRTFAFTFKPGETPDAKSYGRIYELAKEAGQRAKKRNMRLAIENVGGSYVWKGEDSAKLLKAVKSGNIGLTWDPNNAGEGGEKAFPDGYRLLDPSRILHVHLRDYRHRPDGKVEWCAVGQGEFDNLGQIRALLKDGFKGTFTLETHYRDSKGKAFASKTSLTALLKIIEQV
ncbi:MAG TPA: sugar phosphate isomerase/epimerase family protein [Bryobacteraceae bacterium]|nr:sugar phosphate isomerase/epimerase family protein [Bryobacteraceae bacterium]